MTNSSTFNQQLKILPPKLSFFPRANHHSLIGATIFMQKNVENSHRDDMFFSEHKFSFLKLKLVIYFLSVSSKVATNI